MQLYPGPKIQTGFFKARVTDDGVLFQTSLLTNVEKQMGLAFPSLTLGANDHSRQAVGNAIERTLSNFGLEPIADVLTAVTHGDEGETPPTLVDELKKCFEFSETATCVSLNDDGMIVAPESYAYLIPCISDLTNNLLKEENLVFNPLLSNDQMNRVNECKLSDQGSLIGSTQLQEPLQLEGCHTPQQSILVVTPKGSMYCAFLLADILQKIVLIREERARKTTRTNKKDFLKEFNLLDTIDINVESGKLFRDLVLIGSVAKLPQVAQPLINMRLGCISERIGHMLFCEMYTTSMLRGMASLLTGSQLCAPDGMLSTRSFWMELACAAATTPDFEFSGKLTESVLKAKLRQEHRIEHLPWIYEEIGKVLEPHQLYSKCNMQQLSVFRTAQGCIFIDQFIPHGNDFTNEWCKKTRDAKFTVEVITLFINSVRSCTILMPSKLGFVNEGLSADDDALIMQVKTALPGTNLSLNFFPRLLPRPTNADDFTPFRSMLHRIRKLTTVKRPIASLINASSDTILAQIVELLPPATDIGYESLSQCTRGEIVEQLSKLSNGSQMLGLLCTFGIAPEHTVTVPISKKKTLREKRKSRHGDREMSNAGLLKRKTIDDQKAASETELHADKQLKTQAFAVGSLYQK